MNKIRPIVFALFLLVVLPVKAVMAGPNIKLSPSSESREVGSNFSVNIAVDSGTVKSIATDVYLTYDATKLEVVSVVAIPNSTFVNDMVPNTDTDGKIMITFFSAAGGTANDATVIKGDIAVINFKAIATGTASVKFDCIANNSGDTNIFDLSGIDVIDCASNVNGSYTITTASSGGTSNPTSTPVVSYVTAVPGELPKTGGMETTIGLMIFGLVGALAGVALRWL